MIDPTANLVARLDDPDPEPDPDTEEIPEMRAAGRPRKVKPKGWDVPVPERPFTPAWAADRALLPRRPPGQR